MFARKQNEPRKLDLTVFSEHISRGVPVDPNYVYISSSHQLSKSPHMLKMQPNDKSLTVGCYNDFVYVPVRFLDNLKDNYIVVPRVLRSYLGYDGNYKINPELAEVSDKSVRHVDEAHFGICKVTGAALRGIEINADAITGAIRNRFASQKELYLLKPDQRLAVSVQGYEVELLVAGLDIDGQSLLHTSSQFGVLTADSSIRLQNYISDQLSLAGDGVEVQQAVPEPVEIPLDFSKLGVGGHKKIIEQLVRRVFYTRVMNEADLKAYGIRRHARGVLLYGPPGTGKTLLVTSLASLFPNSQVRMINGPELMSSYVGASQANIGALFEEAKRNPGKLYIFFFDEVDAIAAKRRDGGGTSSDVLNQMVSRLLTETDGANSAQNVIVFFSTNRKDMVDEALLRAGRVDAHFYVGLPGREDRLEILQIHTRDMSTLGKDVDLAEIAVRAENYSGAELAQVVQVASQHALRANLVEDADTLKMRDMKSANELARVTQQHFILALQEVKPAFGRAGEIVDCADKFVAYDANLMKSMSDFRVRVRELLNRQTGGKLAYLISGGAGTGKSTLARQLVLNVKLPHVQVIEPSMLVGLSENEQISLIKSVFARTRDSREPSAIILDDIEDIIESDAEHLHYNNRLRILLNAELKQHVVGNRKLLVLGTCKDPAFLRRLGLGSLFQVVLESPPVTLDCRQVEACSSVIQGLCQAAGYTCNADINGYEGVAVQMPVGVLIDEIHQYFSVHSPGKVSMRDFMLNLPQEFRVQGDKVAADNTQKPVRGFFRN